jgi:hypothetical protein
MDNIYRSEQNYQIMGQMLPTSLKQLIGRTFTGKELNSLLNGMPLLKFMYDTDTHYGMHYVTGSNLDILPFSTVEECSPGGLYVTTLDKFYDHYGFYGDYARRVWVPDNALVHIEHNKIKCDEIYLEDRVLKDDLLKSLFKEYLEYLMNISDDAAKRWIYKMIRRTSYAAMKFIGSEFLTPEIMKCAVKEYGSAIQFIKDTDRTDEMIIEAVKQNGHAIQFIKENQRTYEAMICAVKQNGSAIQYISSSDRTCEMMIRAFKQDGYAIKYMEDDLIRHCKSVTKCTLALLTSALVINYLF